MTRRYAVEEGNQRVTPVTVELYILCLRNVACRYGVEEENRRVSSTTVVTYPF